MRSITVGGVADKDGQLSVGDQILEVQDKNLIDVHYEKVRDSVTHLIFACSLFLDLAPVHPSVRPSIHHALSYRVCVILPQFLQDLFETLHTCCGHIEDVHVGFWWS